MKQKILLVGDPRICPQVAYVMDWQDYEMVEYLTDVERYRDYKIVICAFKKKSKRLVKIKDKSLAIIYLDDICRELDAEELTNSPLRVIVDKPAPWWRRIIDRIKAGEVLIAISRRYRRKYGPLKSKFWIDRLPFEQLTISEILVKVLYSKPTNIDCKRLGNYYTIFKDGNLYGCCPPLTPPLGSVEQSSLLAVYNSRRARIIKLSMLNRSYCFCDLKKCEFFRTAEKVDKTMLSEQTMDYPQCLEFAIDETCNLRCPSCRTDFCTANSIDQGKVENIVTQVKQSKWLEQVPHLVLQGVGEVFCSTALKPLLATGMNRSQIHILSNGTLFNRQNWELLKNKYQQIDVEISVDAATAPTYQKIRGGNFGQLMQNLAMLSELRGSGEIRYLELNFVVQKDNYHEMADFVRLARRLHADKVHFTHLNNWGTFTEREYRKKCLIVRDRRLHRDLRRVLRDPIFGDPIVDLLAFSRYIKNFAQKFPQSL